MKKFKKVKALLISSALVAAFGAMTVFGATSSTQSTSYFKANVNYWESTFKDEYTTPIRDSKGDKYAYFKWTDKDSSDTFYLKMKIKNNNTGNEAASEKITKMDTAYNKIPSIAIKDEYYRLYLTREYVLDTKVKVGGYWAP